MRRSLLLLLGPLFAAVAWACSDNGPVTASLDAGADVADAGPGYDASGIVVRPDSGQPTPYDAGKLDSGEVTATDAEVTVDSGFDAGACHKVGANQACGLAPQCGCASTQTCEFSAGETRCVGPPGNGVAGNFCVSTASCGLGLTCLYDGTCHAFCADAGQPCGDASACIPILDQDGGAVPELAVCEVACVLSDPASCGAEAQCYPSQITATGTDCARAGTPSADAGPEAGCTYLNDCAPGYGCVGAPDAGTGQCQRWCRVGQAECGDAGLACVALNPSLVLGGTQYGSCR